MQKNSKKAKNRLINLDLTHTPEGERISHSVEKAGVIINAETSAEEIRREALAHRQLPHRRRVSIYRK